MLEQLEARKTGTRIRRICVYGVNSSEGKLVLSTADMLGTVAGAGLV
jgi:hypothetical protein